MKNSILVCLLGFATFPILAQDTISPPTWDDISWIVGDWVGDGFGGVSYEHWSQPIAGTMLGTYRHVGDGKNSFFELFTISKNADGTFIMKLRHFNPDLSAWEDKEGQLVWEWKGKTNNGFTFGPCTYNLVGEGQMEIELKMINNGKPETEIFHFQKFIN